MWKKRRWLKWFVIICSIFIAGIVAAAIWINSILPKKIREKLKELAPMVQVDFSSIQTHILASSFTFHQVSIIIQPDSSHTTNTHSMQFDELSVDGVELFQFIINKKLRIRKILLDKGQVRLDKFLLDQEDDAKNKHQKIQLPFKEMIIQQFEIKEATVWLNAKGSGSPLLTGDLTLHDIVMNDSAGNEKDQMHVAGIECHAKNLRYVLAKSYHTLLIKSFSLNSQDELLRLDSLQIVPHFGKLEFGPKVGYQADRIDMSIRSIECIHPDIMQLFDKKLVAEKITVKDGRAFVFRDRRIPMKPERKPLPSEYLSKIPIDVRVGQLSIGPVLVVYEEFPKDGIESGTLKIEKLKMLLTPFASHPRSKEDHINMLVSGSIMGAGDVDASIHLPFKTGDPYEVKGAFHNLNLVSLNPSAENLGRFHIRSGLLNLLSFQFSMDSTKATGQIIGEYHDLVIDKLKKDQKKGDKADWFKSFVLQHLIIRKNKDKSMPVEKRTGKVDYQRDPNRFFSHYMLHALLSGVKSSFTLGFLLPG